MWDTLYILPNKFGFGYITYAMAMGTKRWKVDGKNPD
jgi:hypothetical protein